MRSSQHVSFALGSRSHMKLITSIDIIGDDSEQSFTFRVRNRKNEKTEEQYFSAESLDQLSLWVRVLNDEHDITASSR